MHIALPQRPLREGILPLNKSFRGMPFSRVSKIVNCISQGHKRRFHLHDGCESAPRNLHNAFVELLDFLVLPGDRQIAHASMATNPYGPDSRRASATGTRLSIVRTRPFILGRIRIVFGRNELSRTVTNRFGRGGPFASNEIRRCGANPIGHRFLIANERKHFWAPSCKECERDHMATVPGRKASFPESAVVRVGLEELRRPAHDCSPTGDGGGFEVFGIDEFRQCHKLLIARAANTSAKARRLSCFIVRGFLSVP
jgi:hypothetical protein